MYKCNNCKHEDLQARANKFCLKCGDNVVEIKDKVEVQKLDIPTIVEKPVEKKTLFGKKR